MTLYALTFSKYVILLLHDHKSFRTDFIMPKELPEVFIQLSLSCVKSHGNYKKRKQPKSCVQTPVTICWGLNRVVQVWNSLMMMKRFISKSEETKAVYCSTD